MKSIIALLVAVVAVQAFTEIEYQTQFTEFAVNFNKSYSADEFFYRFRVFRQTLDMIEEHNAKGESWWMGVNQFSDLTQEEFEKIYLGFLPRDDALAPRQESGLLGFEQAAATVDWTTQGAVTAVKDQGQCGSCWAFSTTGSVEGVTKIKKGTLPNLSESQLVDCAGSAGNQGCNGGLMDNAFKWIMSNGGIASETSYPYKPVTGTCKTGVASAATITGFTDVDRSETALQAAVTLQPVSIAVDARKWSAYAGGIFTGCGLFTQLDHGVLAVGYDGTSWKVKNSWGTSWGEQGYIRLAMGKNMCGLTKAASYPQA